MNAPQTALVGRHVGRYRISRHIASGGMGAVYEVIQDSIGHRAAIKILSASLSSDPKHSKYVERFLDEARAVNLINDPGVLQIFDFGEMQDHTVYILMEYIEGQSLGDALRKFREGAQKRMPMLQNVQIIRQVASVMAVAHEKGVLHRDIKPSNLMLLADPSRPGGVRVKVIDFGLAKFLDTPERRTTAGMTVGTAHYMSPEQCLGEDNFDGKVDVYALGAVLYEMLSGDPPFQGEAGSVMRKHVNDVPRPLSEVGSNVPGAIVKLTHRMLEKKPEARPTMAEVNDALAKLEESGEIKDAGPSFLAIATGQATDAHAPTMPGAAIAKRSAARPDEPPTARLRLPKPTWIAALGGGGLVLGLLLGIAASSGLRRSDPLPPAAPAPVCPPAPTADGAGSAARTASPAAAGGSAAGPGPATDAVPVEAKGASKSKKGKAAKKGK